MYECLRSHYSAVKHYVTIILNLVHLPVNVVIHTFIHVIYMYAYAMWTIIVLVD